jgi:hypothetical protein
MAATVDDPVLCGARASGQPVYLMLHAKYFHPAGV